MSLPRVLLVASTAAFASVGPKASVEAFHLQPALTKGGIEASRITTHMELFKGPSSAPTAPMAAAGPPWQPPASQLSLSAVSNSLDGVDSSPGADNSVLAMASFLRCHKPLLNDRGPEIPDGNLCMLLRGCDAHQRMISPLELKTNAEALPGAAAAGVMASKGTAAAEAICKQLAEDLKLSKTPHGLCPVELLKLEVGKVHRLLQFATAAGLKKNFLSKDALLVMLELYEEVGIDSSHIVQVVRGLKDFYQKEMDEKSFKEFFLPAYEEVLANFEETKKLVRHAEKVPFSSLPFEPTPDPRTMTPLVVDIMQFKDKLRRPTFTGTVEVVSILGLS